MQVKFTPAPGTYTKEEWDEWMKNTKAFEDGTLPPKIDEEHKDEPEA